MPEATSVSIHAPTRGATPQGGHAGGDLGFNSRAHAGRDVTGCEPVSDGCEFQFTRPRGARLAQLALGVGQSGFNSRAHAGRDRRRLGGRQGSPCFNSRAHAGRDTGPLPAPATPASFNSRAHAGRDMSSPTRRRARQFQFTRPRGARPADHAQAAGDRRVSIHAPTRGATSRTQAFNVAELVSIHAPTRGATRDSSADPYDSIVSIHAPTRGAT